MKVRDVLKLLHVDGWVLVHTRGSHHHFRHPAKPGTVTVPGNPNFDLHPKTLASILRQAGFDKEEEP
jgi:predicted RNA binding protein YcfA (HicA-like mRNA interferase family)